MVEWYLQRKQKYSEKTCPVPLCPPQIPHGLTRARTRASAVRGQRLTAWVMARPYLRSKWIQLGETDCLCYLIMSRLYD
jgi:hypothetical protein